MLLLVGGKGIVEEIVARDSGTFTREDAMMGQVTTVAGIDQLVAVFAAREPVPSLGLLDRLLVSVPSWRPAWRSIAPWGIRLCSPRPRRAQDWPICTTSWPGVPQR